MNLPQTGGCLCGKIRYEITEAPQRVYTHATASSDTRPIDTMVPARASS